MVQEVLGQCEAENGTKIDELLQAGARGHKRTWNMLKRIQVLEDGMVPAKEATYWKIEGQKRRIKRTKVFEAFEQFRDGKFHVAIKIVAVRSMSVVLERRHRPPHMRALLARWNGREQEIRQVHS